MTRYLCWTEKTESWRGETADRHITDAFREKYEIICNSEDHVIDPDAETQFALAAAGGDYDLIYCDEDEIKNNERQEPFFKPDYSPDTQHSTGYIYGMYAVRKGMEYDSLSGFERERVCHIPRVLYHRTHGRTYGLAMFGQKHAFMRDSCQSIKESHNNVSGRGPDASDTPRKLSEEDEQFFVDRFDHSISIVILSKDHPDMLERCVSSIKLSTYADDVELILVDNGSSGENRAAYEKLSDRQGIRYFYEPIDFNYSKLNNIGASKARGDVLIFMNDDIEIPAGERGVLEKLALKSMEERTGAVGVKLLYPGEERIQHCGVTLLYSGPSHKLQGYLDDTYYYGYSENDINTLAVTGACLAISRGNYESIGGFDESLPVAYNDVDLCLRLYEKGLYNVCVNSEHLIHYESVTRPDDRYDRESYGRLAAERRYFTTKHREIIERGDPFMSPNLTHFGLDFDIDLPEEWETSGLTEPKVTGKKIRTNKHVRASMDRFDYRLSDAFGNEDFYEISGWIFKEKDSRMIPKVIIETKGIKYMADTAFVTRKDVAEAFPKEKHSLRAGFITRIPASVMDNIKVWGEVTAYPVLMGKNGKLYKGEEECRKTREIS